MQKNNEKDVTDNDQPEIIYRGVKTMPLIIGNETFEKLGTIGTSHNLLVYLTTVFNMKSITATTLINVFNGTTNFAALPGAFLCDTYFGRYKTLGFASVSSFLGMVILTLTAGVTNFHPQKCVTNGIDGSTCSGPNPWQLAILFAGLACLVVGAAGIRPCNLAFGADQFNPNTESGKKGIDSFFNWYYFTFTFAMMVSLTLIVYVQSELSWTWGLAIPAFLMLLSCIFFFAGSKIYVKVRPDGSPFTSAARVVVAAIRKRRLSLSSSSVSFFDHVPSTSYNSKLPHTHQFRFLDKAAMMAAGDKVNPDGSAAEPWRLCSIQQVEEIKCLMRVVPIWASFIIYFVASTQQSTYVVFQALQSNRLLSSASNFSVPAGSFSFFTMLGLTVWIPIYDRILVPSLRRLTGRPSGVTVLQRMGFGMVLSVLTMLLSGLVEAKRRALALSDPIGLDPRRGAISSLSGFWLVPQLTLIGISEAFTIIAHVEFYYKQFPENMRSVGGSFTFMGMGLSSYLSGFLVSTVHRMSSESSMGDWLPDDLNKGKLDWFYYLTAAMGVANFGYFLVFSRWYRYKETSAAVASEVDMKNMQSEKSIV